ncbi:MAG: hypothetical protein F6K37_40145 [Moorea sp. SIO4E2]|uniref:hypothetical protein n=1 Tax=Moorena sp. SIO4E2 TaxID=2607826 RepID=UPI0013BA295E|nr:hypothetical protein [Moorena sp. SIO4E2]NEQ11857.1 hypothetical protein [Moorena sp. SIO4E2]
MDAFTKPTFLVAVEWASCPLANIDNRQDARFTKMPIAPIGSNRKNRMHSTGIDDRDIFGIMEITPF